MHPICIVFIGIVSIFSSGKCSEWQYKGKKGPQKWSSIASACGSSVQSPVNIISNDIFPNPNLGLLKLTGYTQTLSGGKFINNGHTVQLDLPVDKEFELTGEGIDGKYKALQLHFHWSKSNSSIGGSEHTINGEHYDAEMHIVHIKQPYTSMDQVKDMSDGLAVVGVFLKVAENADDNPHFQLLLNATKTCHYSGETSFLTIGPSLLSLLPQSGSYYRYNGSLTTPPCYETVLWSIYQEPVVISRKQLEIFQSLSAMKPLEATKADANHHASDGKIESLKLDAESDMSDNYRPIQPLHGRVVSVYYDISVSIHQAESETSWHYEGEKGPQNWSKYHDQCKGNKQSPINFVTNSTSFSSDVGKLEFSHSYHDKSSGHVTNNGHTVMYTLGESDEIIFTNGGKQYKALQVHFHWGTASVEGNAVSSIGGSEHTVDGKHFPIEMHIVHKKVNPDEEHDDDLAVISVFFDLCEEEDLISTNADEALKDLTDAFHQVLYEDEDAPLKDGPALYNILPSNKSYFRYMGSLTTPPCTESVMWSVFTKPVPVSKERFLEFQSFFKVTKSQIIQLNSTDEQEKPEDTSLILKESILVGNYRPTQPYNAQLVVIYVDTNSQSLVPSQANTTAIVLCTLAGLLVFAGLLAMMLCCRKTEKTQDDTTYQQVSTTQPLTHASAAEMI